MGFGDLFIAPCSAPCSPATPAQLRGALLAASLLRLGPALLAIDDGPGSEVSVESLLLTSTLGRRPADLRRNKSK